MSREVPEAFNTISGGIQNGPVVQARDMFNTTFVTTFPEATPVALAQLPALVTAFTGRDAELAQIASVLNPAAGETPVVLTVAGLAGVGKTALAVHSAHRARLEGWFAGGVLFIDLHGYDDNPVQPRQALDALLRALGVPIEHIPEDVDQRGVLYRSYLAKISNPVLIVLDNASTEAQVRPLLPGPGPHRVIATSRHTLAGLGARLLDVAVLDTPTAVALLDGVVRAARPNDDRVSRDGRSAEALAGACSGLPLALQIAAALLVSDSTLTAQELADRLADEVSRLQTLRYDDGDGSSALSVEAAFTLSYRQLDQDAARMFRLLPANPGPDISIEAAGVLTSWERVQTRTVLGRLAKAHLVEPTADASSRWRMHDLVRLYGRELPDSGERGQATAQLLAWYLRRTHAANQHLVAQPGVPVPGDFAGIGAALSWMDAQRLNLIASVGLAAGTGEDRVAVQLTKELYEYLLQRRFFDDLLILLGVCLDSARRLGDAASEAVALDRRGVALREEGRFDESVRAHKEAARAFGEIDDQHGLAIALGHLAAALEKTGRLEQAVSVGEKSTEAFRKHGDQRGTAMALTNLGGALRQAGRDEEAASAFGEAAEIYRQTGNQREVAMALGNLGVAMRDARRYEEAITAFGHAEEMFRQVDDRYSLAMSLNNLGLTMQEAGQFQTAIKALREAAEIFRELGDRPSADRALGKLGMALRSAGRSKEAISVLQKAVAISRRGNDRRDLGLLLANLGMALRDTGMLEAADGFLREATSILGEIGVQPH